MIAELDPVVLTTDLPEHGLRAGDVGWIVMVHAGGAGYEVEFVTLAGDTVSVVTVPAESVRRCSRTRSHTRAGWHRD
jgi:hypothetical protein